MDRPRLLDRLDAGADRALTVVCSPAGSGKTTLLAEWAEKREPHAVWISLDEYDNQFHRFWGHLIAAVDGKYPGFADKLGPAWSESGGAAPESLVFQLINGLERLPSPPVIILDDYHLIENADVHRSFEYLVERMPAGVRCVLASRVAPPFKLARYAVSGKLDWIDGRQMNFTEAEGQEFCRLQGRNLTGDVVRRLMERTEGWIAGMKLAVLSLNESGSKGSFPFGKDAPVSGMSAYLFEEVYSKLAPDDRKFLIYTSLPDRVCGGLCEALTGQTDGQHRLEMLYRANLFMVSLDSEGTWFRYHHLFADFLRARLTREEPEAVPRLHLRAGMWFRDNGQAEAAMEHFLAGRHEDEAVELMNDLLPAMIDKEWETMNRWMSAVAQERLEKWPDLFLARMFFAIAAGEKSGFIDALIRRGEELTGGISSGWPEERKREYASSLALIKALHAVDYLFDVDAAIVHMKECAELAPEVVPLQHIEINPGEMSILRAFQYTEPDAAKLESFFRVMLELWHREHEEPYVFTGIFCAGYGELCFEQNRLEEAEELITRGIRIARLGKSGRLLAPAAAALTAVYRAQGRSEDARRIIGETQGLLEEWGFGYWSHLMHAVRIRQLMAENSSPPPTDLHLIDEWVRENEKLLQEEFPRHSLYVAITVVRGYMTLGRILEAAERIGELLERTKRERRHGETQELLVLQAVCLMRQNRLDAAFMALSDVLKTAESNRTIRPLTDERGLTDLLKLYLRYCRKQTAEDAASVSYSFIQMLIALAETDHSRAGADTEALADERVHLTLKEREVLALMSQGMPNRLIAERLDISPGTLKTHIHHIYRKLSVSDRWSAVQRARELLNMQP